MPEIEQDPEAEIKLLTTQGIAIETAAITGHGESNRLPADNIYSRGVTDCRSSKAQ